MSSLVSIIIPIYLAEDTLSQCIESCCKQTYDNIELLLVVDGSPDNSLQICQEYALVDSRIRVIHKENSGVSDTRNTGILNATGDYITFVDADDWLEPDAIHNLVNFQSQHDLDLATTGFAIVRDNAFDTSLIPTTEIITGTDNIAQHLVSESKLRFYRAPYAKLYKRELINTHNIMFDTTLKINEDFIFILSYLQKCQTIGTFEYCSYNYNQIMTERKIQHYELQDYQKQWDLALFQFRAYRSFFEKTNTYKGNENLINAYLVTCIRGFVSSTILARGKSQSIKTFLAQIPSLPEYSAIRSLKYKTLSGIVAKIALFCIRHKAWSLFCFCFQCKNLLYSSHVYQYKKD